MAPGRREAENQAWADYLVQVGKAIYAATVLSPSGVITLTRPMLFTVLQGATPEAICHWLGNRLQPIWHVRPVGAQPDRLKQQARLWIYGHEYDSEGRFFASSHFSPALTTAMTQMPAKCEAMPAAAPPPPSRASLEAQALREYEAHLGRVLEVRELCGYVEALGDEVIYCVPPATVRVVQTSADFLLQWRDNELWSQWQVEAVAPRTDLARAKQLRVFGPAWRQRRADRCAAAAAVPMTGPAHFCWQPLSDTARACNATANFCFGSSILRLKGLQSVQER